MTSRIATIKINSVVASTSCDHTIMLDLRIVLLIVRENAISICWK